mmetsp:Transcript_52749/g.123803  ORF Transcript_52749/g.123803 Transcript_52749/m.123803 type:complete len:214 (-) Transcript_52749:607-1248(-)
MEFVSLILCSGEIGQSLFKLRFHGGRLRTLPHHLRPQLGLCLGELLGFFLDFGQFRFFQLHFLLVEAPCDRCHRFVSHLLHHLRILQELLVVTVQGLLLLAQAHLLLLGGLAQIGQNTPKMVCFALPLLLDSLQLRRSGGLWRLGKPGCRCRRRCVHIGRLAASHRGLYLWKLRRCVHIGRLAASNIGRLAASHRRMVDLLALFLSASRHKIL